MYRVFNPSSVKANVFVFIAPYFIPVHFLFQTPVEESLSICGKMDIKEMLGSFNIFCVQYV
jgi:hypothetical protein